MKLVLCYKYPGSLPAGAGHGGIGNTCRNIQSVLLQNGIPEVEIWPIAGGDVLLAKLQADTSGITHVSIAAPFIPLNWMQQICNTFPTIKFACVSHSNVGFLQAEPAAISLMRGYANLTITQPNFFAAGNNQRLVDAFNLAYGRYIRLLPNLYDLNATPQRRARTAMGGVIKIGSFGALRVQKNFTSATWAALGIARNLGMDLQFFVNVGRDDNTGGVVQRAIEATISGLAHATLMPISWQDPMQFRQIVSGMHLLIQPSYTETFSMVTADAIAEGVPVVVTEAVEWCPSDWKAESDDISDIIRVGQRLIQNPYSAWEGYQALVNYNRDSIGDWMGFLR